MINIKERGFVMKKIGILVLTFVVTACSTTSEQTELAKVSSEQANEKKLICKRHKQTGTRIGGKKLCLTADQWAVYRDRMKEQVDNLQQRRHQPVRGSGIN